MVSRGNETNKDKLDSWGRVVVLMGGHSAEREISLESGRVIAQALRAAGINTHELNWDGDLVTALLAADADRVFIALHGRGGEDGSVQGLLESMSLPYTGSGVLGSALSMDKVRAKQLWARVDVPTPPYVEYNRGDCRENLAAAIQYPVIVKPVQAGSSLGISRVDTSASLDAAIDDALAYDDDVLIEKWISGAEYTLAILDDRPLPIIKLETPHEFYDYDAKYISTSTRYICPSGLNADVTEQCARLGVKAFKALGASGWGRVDFMLDENQQPWFIELNTVPGMTDHSLVPMAAAADGLTFEQLVLQILRTSLREMN